MEIDLFWLLTAAAGGFFGAAIGGLQAFIFTGFMVLIGIIGLFGGSGTMFMDYVAFGPVFGPHIGFAGGVAAVAYARKRGYADGKDIVTPLISLVKPDVLLVGAVFGVIGYLVNAAVAVLPWFGSHTDTVAVAVVVSALIARFAFGNSGLVGLLPQGSGWGRFAPNDDNNWIRYHEKFYPNSVLGLFAGGLAAGTALMIAESFPDAAGVAHTFVFGASAVSLLFLSLGMSVPVTHHITIIGGLGALTFFPIVGENLVAALLIGALFGMVSAWTAEFFSRFWHIHGDTHIDPPASAIWPMTTLVLGLGALLS